jgi:hypothetical protein
MKVDENGRVIVKTRHATSEDMEIFNKWWNALPLKEREYITLRGITSNPKISGKERRIAKEELDNFKKKNPEVAMDIHMKRFGIPFYDMGLPND